MACSLSYSLVILMGLPFIQAQADIPQPKCTNTSTWGPVTWKDSEESCCLTRIIEPDCIFNMTEVCVDLNETICEIETWQECTMTPCPVTVTIPEHVPEYYPPWYCKDIWANVTHHKKRPIPVNKTIEECDEIWITNEDGEMVFGGKENCYNKTWLDYDYEWYDVHVMTKESNCTKGEPIEYLTCRNTTKESEQMCTNCVAKALPKCELKTRPKCKLVRTKTCKPQIKTDCDWHYKIPMQDFKHKKRCVGHDEVPPTPIPRRANNLLTL